MSIAFTDFLLFFCKVFIVTIVNTVIIAIIRGFQTVREILIIVFFVCYFLQPDCPFSKIRGF
jgi:hypothetical protein